MVCRENHEITKVSTFQLEKLLKLEKLPFIILFRSLYLVARKVKATLVPPKRHHPQNDHHHYAILILNPQFLFLKDTRSPLVIGQATNNLFAYAHSVRNRFLKGSGSFQLKLEPPLQFILQRSHPATIISTTSPSRFTVDAKQLSNR